MILLDANLLLYAKITDYPQHDKTRRWLEERINGSRRVGMPWPTLLAFLRIITNPRLFERSLPMDAAWEQISEWLAMPAVWIPLPTERHAEVLEEIFSSVEVSANLVPDAHLAALAMEHGLTLCSTDNDFSRFPRLRWENPLL
jgi:toxin-antitoxin system PIN domain toxin